MTSNIRERIETAQWVFDKTLGWVAAAEVKVAAICAIDTAMLAGLGALFLTDSTKSAWANVFGVGALLSLFFGLICAALVLIPRLDGGPTHSKIYFGKIANLTVDAYEKQFQNAPEEEFFSDLTAQIHFNARIAQKKHEWARRCLYWSLFGAFPWLGAVFAALTPASV